MPRGKKIIFIFQGDYIMTQDNKNPRVKKSTSMIHVNNKSISLLQRKIYNILLWNACSQGFDQDIFTIDISQLVSISGKRTRNFVHIIDSITRLQTTLVQWDLFGESDFTYQSIQLLGGVRVKDGILYYEFSKMLKPYVFHPEIFSFVRVNITNLFTSKYAIALYENCIRFKDVKSTGWKTVDEWRTLIGVPDEKLYELFANINARIIKVAVKQINKLSDITIIPEYKREGKGKAVTHIKFTIEKNEGFVPLTTPPEQLSLLDYSEITKKWIQKFKDNQGDDQK